MSDAFDALRTADAGGINGWLSALGAGMPRDVVALGFYQSPEKLGLRVTALYGKLLGRSPEAGAASHWSKRKNTALDTARPANVEVNSYNYLELRDLFARAAIVVVPRGRPARLVYAR